MCLYMITICIILLLRLNVYAIARSMHKLMCGVHIEVYTCMYTETKHYLMMSLKWYAYVYQYVEVW